MFMWDISLLMVTVPRSERKKKQTTFHIPCKSHNLCSAVVRFVPFTLSIPFGNTFVGHIYVYVKSCVYFSFNCLSLSLTCRSNQTYMNDSTIN